MHRVTVSLVFIAMLATSGWTSPAVHMSAELRALTASAPADTQISAIVYLATCADIAGLDRELHDAKATRAERHRVIVQNLRSTAEATQRDLLALLSDGRSRGDVAGYTPYWITNCIVACATPEVLESLSDHPDVMWVDLNFKIEPIRPIRPSRHALDENHGVPRGIRAIGAPRVWYELGITGRGRLVGNMDSGVDASHPALAARWRGSVAPVDQCWRDQVGESTVPADLVGHGTHVMGTMCGNSLVTNDSVGVAPEAWWIACRVFEQAGGEELNNDVLDGFQWFADPDGDPFTIDDVPDVVQNSWGVSGAMPGYSDCFDLWNNAIVNCEAAGVVVVYSAGNEGSGAQTVRSPATFEIDSVTVFAVGAVDATNDTIPPYNIANFSSRGPSSCSPFTAIKPEVCAPGVDVYSSTNGTYGYKDGTSMAGPHVAGIVALMREANPDVEVRRIKSLLRRTAHDYGTPGDDNTYGMGFVDAYAVVESLLVGQGFVRCTVSSSQTGQPIGGAVISSLDGVRQSRTRADGTCRMVLPGDSLWSLRVGGFGYQSQLHQVLVTIGDTSALDVSLEIGVSTELSGVVMAGDSIPVVNATVSFPGYPVSAISTDTTGHFEITLPADTTYRVVVAYHDASTEQQVRLQTGLPASVSLYLSSPRSGWYGPDAGGYRCFDRYDTGRVAPFDWVEIAPPLGGNGTIISLAARDSSGYVGMPFPLVYYGQTFDSLTINENGWIAAGITHDHSFFNFPIPGLSGPAAMMAPLWDNLHDGDDGDISYWYDSVGVRFIIEYRDVQYQPPSNLRTTFQVQIYSTVSRPTASGDCEIMFLYKRVDYAENCTVGIENPSETFGLQVLYNDSFDVHSWLVGPYSALRFTTRNADFVGRVTGTISAHPAAPDLSAATIHVGGKLVHAQSNGSFAVDDLLTGTYTARLTLAGYESTNAQVVIGDDSTTTVNFAIWRLDPPRELQATLVSGAVILSWQRPIGSGGRSPLDEFNDYAVYRNGFLVGTTVDTFLVDAIVQPSVFTYWVVAQYDGGVSDTSNNVVVDASSADDVSAMTPADFALDPCFPNPFNAVATLRFAVPKRAHVTMDVFNILGRHAATLLDDEKEAGYHSITWSCAGCPSGLYLIVMHGEGFHFLQKAVLLK